MLRKLHDNNELNRTILHLKRRKLGYSNQSSCISSPRIRYLSHNVIVTQLKSVLYLPTVEVSVSLTYISCEANSGAISLATIVIRSFWSPPRGLQKCTGALWTLTKQTRFSCYSKWLYLDSTCSTVTGQNGTWFRLGSLVKDKNYLLEPSIRKWSIVGNPSKSNVWEMGKELPAINNYAWHIFFRVLTTTVQAGQDTILKYSRLVL